MYQTPTKDETITLYRILDTDKTGYPSLLTRVKNFKDKQALINFLANKIQTYGYTDPSRWEHPFLDDLNFSYKDKEKTENLIYNGYPEFKHLILLTDHDKIVDPRLFLDEIIKYRVYMINKKAEINPNKQRYRERVEFKARLERYKRSRKRIKRHTTYQWRSPRVTKTLRSELDPEYKAYQKPKNTQFYASWSEDFVSRRSTGWKDKKARYQWQVHKPYKQKMISKADKNDLSYQCYLRSIGKDPEDI